MKSSSNNIFLCTIPEIADWQVNAKSSSGIKVAMPAMQRGYVWSASQVEGLWDSLVRQLPIGSFLVTRYQEHLVSEDKVTMLRDSEQPELLLLDGQQRATSVALAFFNPWNYLEQPYPMALWLDLAQPDSNFIDRAFMFRLLTQAHPWGYPRNSLGRLESRQRKDALTTFTHAIRSEKNVGENDPLPQEAKYPGLRVAHSWPWDAVTPLPFALLCDAVSQNTDWQTVFRNSLENVPFWRTSMRTARTECWKQKICDLLDNGEGEEYERLCLLAETLPKVLSDTQIPVINVPEQDINVNLWNIRAKKQSEGQATGVTEDKAPPDAVESLFVRINSAGTPLGGDELIYSTYKSIWPNGQDLVESIGDNAFIRPANLIALSARLVISIEQDKKETQGGRRKDEVEDANSMPPALTVSRFRSLVHAQDETYKNALNEFMNDKATKLFSTARDFLAGTYGNKNDSIPPAKADYRLGSVLMENLARTTPDVYFFFLRWLYDNMDNMEMPLSKKKDVRKHKHIIGALTAIAFFSPNPNGFIRRLWPLRSTAWWSKGEICTNKIMQMDGGKLLMLPLPSPKELQECLSRVLVSDQHSPNKWKSWDWYNNMTREYPKNSNSEYARYCRELLGNNDDGPEESRHADMAWEAFWERLWVERRLVLYAQRHWLDLFFPGYNPAAPDQQEDSDRPFDWDHIFPQGYIYNTRKPLLKMWRHDWPHTIGNLRAWPMELNRCDGKTTPAIKLADFGADNFDLHWKKILPSGAEIRKASFVGADWKHWEQCAGNDYDIKEALTKKSDFGIALLNGIVERLCSLYRNWYEDFEIGNTFGQ